MRTLMLSLLVIALALLTGAHLATAQEMGKATAKLTGDAEVPGPGVSRAVARAGHPRSRQRRSVL